MNDIKLDAVAPPVWIPITALVSVAAVVTVAVIVGMWLRRRSRHGRRAKLPRLPVMSVGTLALVCALSATTGAAAVNANRDRQHVAAVADAVYEEYGVALADTQVKQLNWPIIDWTSMDDWPAMGQTYGKTEVVEGEKARTIQLAWDGSAFVLRLISERSLLPGQALEG